MVITMTMSRGEDIVFDNHVSDYKMKTVTPKDGEVVTIPDMHFECW